MVVVFILFLTSLYLCSPFLFPTALFMLIFLPPVLLSFSYAFFLMTLMSKRLPHLAPIRNCKAKQKIKNSLFYCSEGEKGPHPMGYPMGFTLTNNRTFVGWYKLKVLNDLPVSFEKMEDQIQFDHSLLALLTSKQGFCFLSSLWLSEASFQEAFQGLCSTLTRGKDLCSPTKRAKRKANEKYFASLSGINCESPRTKKRLIDGVHATKILALAQGLSEQSDRWAKMSADDILSVTLLMDVSLRGSVTWQEFYTYCNRVDSALASQTAKNTPQKAIADLYTIMVRDRQIEATIHFVEHIGSAMNEEALSRFTAKLIKLAICARLQSMNPLTLLINLQVHERSVAHKKAEKAAAKKAKELANEGAGAGTGIAAAATSASPTALSVTKEDMPLDALASLFLHLGADVIGEGSEGVQRAKLSYQKKLSASRQSNNTNVKDKGDNNENLENLSISGVDLDVTSTSATSFLLDTPLHLRNPTTSNSNVNSSDLDSSIAMLRENASAISARLAAQGQDVDSAVKIWSALQTLESELTKAAVTSSPRTPATPKVSSSSSGNGNSSSGRPSPVNLFICATPGSANSSPRSMTRSPGVYSTADEYMKIDQASEKQASAVISSGRTPTNVNANASGSSIDSNNSSSRSRISPIANLANVRTNLSIFKSPAARSKSFNNPNVYSEETMTWESNKSNLTNVYNERFQSTNQCIDGRKIFRVLGVGEGGREEGIGAAVLPVPVTEDK